MELLHYILFFTIIIGEIRFYIFLGILLGTLIYMLTISKFFINISVKTIIFLKNLLNKITNYILYPFKIIFVLFRKVFFRPISFIFINIRKIFSKNILNKKDF